MRHKYVCTSLWNSVKTATGQDDQYQYWIEKIKIKTAIVLDLVLLCSPSLLPIKNSQMFQIFLSKQKKLSVYLYNDLFSYIIFQIVDVLLSWNQIITKGIYRTNSQVYLLSTLLIIQRKRYELLLCYCPV